MGTPSGRSRSTRPRTVSATEAAKNFGRLVSAVRESGVEYIVERGGVPVAQLGPVAEAAFCGRDLAALWRSLAAPDAAYARAVTKAQARLNRPSVPRHPWLS